MTDATEALTAGLRAWTKDHDPHVRAAVELLIWHDYWLCRPDFTSACVAQARKWSSGNARPAWINWKAAREFCDGDVNASTSELAILDLAVALGENRYRLSVMGAAHSQAIAAAVRAACGLGAIQLPDPGPVHNHPDFIPCEETCPAHALLGEGGNDG